MLGVNRLGFGVATGLGPRAEDVRVGFSIQGSGLRVQGSGFRVQGSGFVVKGLGFKILKFQGSCAGYCLFLAHGIGDDVRIASCRTVGLTIQIWGFEVQSRVLGFEVQGSGFRALRFSVQECQVLVQGCELRIEDAGFRIFCFGKEVWGLELSVKGL